MRDYCGGCNAHITEVDMVIIPDRHGAPKFMLCLDCITEAVGQAARGCRTHGISQEVTERHNERR